MAEQEYRFQSIGVVHSPFQDPEGMPIQPGTGQGARGTIVLEPALTPGLQDLEGFSHLILVYYFHQAGEYQLQVKPFLDDTKRGLFATRAPRRPNPIGISVVRLLGIEDNVLQVQDLDILDGTPLLDIKPYVPEFDRQEEVRIGWLEKQRGRIPGKLSDDRFS
jgi:tRNA-Thr(GGU) m(6)t(6)A37 methyltransferase TsaA